MTHRSGSRLVFGCALLLSAAARGADGPADESSVQLDRITITGKLDALSKSDARLKAVGKALPCFGCDGKRFDETPLALRLGLDVGAAVVRSFLQQPRVRGEPADEALYHALRSGNCIGDVGTSGCPDNDPSPALYNWVADSNAGNSQYEYGLLSGNDLGTHPP